MSTETQGKSILILRRNWYRWAMLLVLCCSHTVCCTMGRGLTGLPCEKFGPMDTCGVCSSNNAPSGGFSQTGGLTHHRSGSVLNIPKFVSFNSTPLKPSLEHVSSRVYGTPDGAFGNWVPVKGSMSCCSRKLQKQCGP